MKSATIQVENNDLLGTLRGFLGRLLESKIVDAVLVPKVLPSADGFVQSLVKDPAMLKDANPVAPTMPVQSAGILSELTAGPMKGRIGVVLKPCELRAAVELAKFLQVDMENLVTIGVDCPGTYEVKDYAEMARKDPGLLSQGFLEGGNGQAFRASCQVCEYPSPVNADITLGFFGQDPSREVLLIIGDRLEQEIAERLSLQLTDGTPAARDQAVENAAAERKEKRAAVLQEFAGQTSSVEKLLETLSTCVRCHNCMNVCPICYCKECVFNSSVFEHTAEQLVNLAQRKGAVRLPSDTLIFHLTRLSHMATSCVGCGLCESACPNQLPVARLFQLIGKDVQEMFEYVPGRDAAEEPPVSVFKEDELQSETGRH